MKCVKLNFRNTFYYAPSSKGSELWPFFTNFTEIKGNFVAKKLCDELSKIKQIWDDSLEGFSVGCVMVLLSFFCRRNFHGEVCKTKLLLFNILRKTEKYRFWGANFTPKNAFLIFFHRPIFLFCPRGSFCTPKLLPWTSGKDIYQQ